MRPRLSAASAVVAAAAALGAALFASPAAAWPDTGVSISAGPRWGGVPPGSWTPYLTTVRNDGEADVSGEIVLLPRPEPPPKPGAATTTTAAATTGAAEAPPQQLVVVAAGRALTAPRPLLAGSAALKPEWPSYRVPVVVPVGSEKTFTVMVREAPFGYDVEVRDRRGRSMASAPAQGGVARTAVLLLSDVAGADGVLQLLPQRAMTGVVVTQLRSAHDFPETALQLAGLNGVLIDDADTTLLNERQRQALRDYVSLGGALVVAGGAAWRRTLGGLPPELAPLRPSGTTIAPVGVLADLAGATTAATASVATGEVGAGRVVVGAPGGPPLVVEAAYGAGTVTQLAYDALAEPIASDPAARGPAWDQALLRMASPRSVGYGQSTAAAADQLGWSALAGLEGRGWPSWPGWLLAAFVAYAVIVLPAALALSRRWRAGVTLAVLLPASGLVATIVACGPAGSHVRQSIVEVHTVARGGAVLETAYRAVVGAGRDDAVSAPAGGAISTVLTGGPFFRLGGPDMGAEEQQLLLQPMSGGAGGGVILAARTGPGVRFGSAPHEVREAETVSLAHAQPSLDAELRLTGSGTAVRLVGSVTNRGPVTLRGVLAQLRGARATIAAALAPGQTMPVDAPVLPMSRVAPGTRVVPGAPEDVVAFAAAGQALTSPNQVALVATARAPVRRGETRHITAVVTVVPIASGTTMPAGPGTSRVVSLAGEANGTTLTTLDLEALPGVGPLSVRYTGEVVPEGEPPPERSTVEIYDWTTGRWRPVPAWRRPAAIYYDTRIDVALQPSEGKDGLVRMRTRTDGPSSAVPQLFATGNPPRP